LLICQSALIGKLLRRFDSGKSNSLIAHLVLDEDEALIERHVLDGHRLDSAHLGRISSILAHEDVVNHIDALLVGDIVVGLHKSSTHGEALLHGLHIEVVTSLDESRLVRDSSVGSISSDILPVNKVLSPSLPLLLTSDGASSEGSVASGGIGKAGALVTSKREVRLEEGGLVRDSGVSGIGLAISKVDEILGPSLPLLLASDGASSEGLVTSGGIGETRALIGSEIELSSNESGSIRLSFVGDISAPFSPIVEVLSPILPSLLASRVIMRLISVGLSRKARATLLASKIELLLSKS
jgi:DNA-directed RNA polymerase subunit H (RpoH/RPB5)